MRYNFELASHRLAEHSELKPIVSEPFVYQKRTFLAMWVA